MTRRHVDAVELRLQYATQQRDEWKAYYGRAVTDNARLRARVAELEETVRLLRVQLPLMPYALGPDPAGPDPRWASTIPEQRRPAHDAAQAAATTPPRGR